MTNRIPSARTNAQQTKNDELMNVRQHCCKTVLATVFLVKIKYVVKD